MRSIDITEFVCVPEDFIIEEHIGIRERMGFFKYPIINLEKINKINQLVKVSGYLKLSPGFDNDTSIFSNESINKSIVASALKYLYYLYELGLILETFKKFSFPNISADKVDDKIISFIKEDLEHVSVTLHIVNIFPLIQNKSFYFENAIQALLKIDEVEMDKQEALSRITKLDQ